MEMSGMSWHAHRLDITLNKFGQFANRRVHLRFRDLFHPSENFKSESDFSELLQLCLSCAVDRAKFTS